MRAGPGRSIRLLPARVRPLRAGARLWPDGVRLLAARAGVTIGYAVALVATTLFFRTLSPPARTAWLEWTSTNLVNLGDHPLPALVLSGLFTEGSLISWLLTALVGLGVTNRVLGNGRTATLIVSAHVGGTLISQGIVAYRIAHGQAPAGDRFMIDVGPSYVVVCALAAAAGYGLGAQRLPALACLALFAMDAFDGLSNLEVAAVGHLCSVVIAVVVGWSLWRSARRLPQRPAADGAAPAPGDPGEGAAPVPGDPGEIAPQSGHPSSHFS